MSKKNIRDGIKYWRDTLAKFIEQGHRSWISKSDLIPLWIGASNEDCVEWCEEEIRLLKEQLKKMK